MKTVNFDLNNSLHAYLFGFLDGDGCIYHKDKTFQVSFSGNINHNWNWFYNAVKKINGPIFNYHKQTTKSKYTKSNLCKYSYLRITSVKALNFLHLLYANNEFFYLKRKKEKYLNYIEFRKLKGYK